MSTAASTHSDTLPGERLLSVPEAARLLHVSPATVRRWIKDGRLHAYRTGRTRLWLRRADVEGLDTHESVIHTPEWQEAARRLRASVRKKMTPEEQARAQEALEKMTEFRKELLAKRGGKPFPDSVEIIREMREERSRELYDRR